MTDNAKAMVLASFVGDSLALGAHWLYDPQEIRRSFGRVETLLAPGPDSYHQGKAAGDFTHYGDQTLTLLRSVADGGFDLVRFAADWRAMIEDYSGYRDHATKSTLGNLGEGLEPDEAGSGSSDLAGASRIAPLVYALRGDETAMIAAVRAQTAMTHHNSMVIDAAEFFGRSALAILKGEEPVSALRAASQGAYESDLPGLVDDALAHTDQDTVASIGAFGQSCHVNGALRGVVQCVARHADSLEEALVQNVMAGGDSAARGMLVGLLLGARHGMAGIPQQWLDALKARAEIEALLDKIG